MFDMKLFAQIVTAAVVISLYMSAWLWLVDDGSLGFDMYEPETEEVTDE